MRVSQNLFLDAAEIAPSRLIDEENSAVSAIYIDTHNDVVFREGVKLFSETEPLL